MLLAIDIGNTHSVYGVWDGTRWLASWRRSTSADDTEDQLAVWLKGMFDLAGIPFLATGVICASVVPVLAAPVLLLAREWLKVEPHFIKLGSDVGLNVDYQPASAVGADRIANALGAMDRYEAPIIVVDFGTATTFDCIDASGTYVGGAILPGVQVSAQALVGKTAKLPAIEFATPDKAIGKTTIESLQSGIMLGYAGAIDTLANRIKGELGGKAQVIATGGLGGQFFPMCETIDAYEPNLTLDGLRIAFQRLTS